MENLFVYVGTYTHKKSEGIYIYRMNPESAHLKPVGKVANINNPSFLTVDPQRRYLYTVNEIQLSGGERSGQVSAYFIDQNSGELTFLNSKSSRGAGPCYVSADKTGRYVLVANYSSGSICVLPVMDDGSLGDATDFVQHEGFSVNSKRQEGPHAHSIIVDPL